LRNTKTEEIFLLEKLVDRLFTAIEQGHLYTVLLVIAIAVIFKLNAILQFFDHQGRKRVSFVQSALKIDEITEDSRLFFKEELNFLLFKKITGISRDRLFQNKALELIRKSKGEIRAVHIERAQKYMSINNGTLIVTLSLWDKIEFVLNHSVAIIMILVSLSTIVLPIASKGISFSQTLTYIILGVLSFFFAIFSFRETVPYKTARGIKPKLIELQITTNQAV
jgi:hypothetical protein